MSREAQRWLASSAAAIAALVVVVCVVMLSWDYAAARFQAAGEEETIAAFQERVRTDAGVAAELEAEHARITANRQARKARGSQLSLLLLIAASSFIASAKWRISLNPKKPAVTAELVRVEETASPPPAAAPPAPLRAPEEIDLTFVDETVAKIGRAKEAAIPILQAIQNHYRYLPDEALQRVCELTEITPAQIAGTSSFYAQFRRSPAGEHVVRVCHGTACHVSGARQITDELRRRLHIPGGEDTDPSRTFTIDEVACLGCCSLAPVLMVDEHTAGKLTPSSACEALEAVKKKEPVA